MTTHRKLLVALPVHNEEVDLLKNVPIIHKFLQRSLRNFEWEIAIVEQASTDKTKLVAERFAREFEHVRFESRPHKGRGGALREIWKKFDGDYLSYMDIDLSAKLEFFPKLITALENGYEIAVGSRHNAKSVTKNRLLFRKFASRSYNIFLKSIFGARFEDAQCGFKAIRKETFQKLEPHLKNTGWLFDTELLILAEKTDRKIAVVPIEWRDDPITTVIMWKYAIEGLWESLRLFIMRPWKTIKK